MGTSFTLGYKIDNNTPVTENYPLAQTLNAGESFTFEFEDSATFASGKIYVFKPFVKLSNDGVLDNDTLLTNNEVNMSAPEINLGANDTVYFTDNYTITIQNFSAYNDYKWSTGETTETIDVTATGTYSVTVTDELGCEGSGEIHCINRTTGIDDLIHGNGYTIAYYPNPASEKLNIEITNQLSKDIKIELINVQGQLLYNNQYSKIQNTIQEIDISNYSKGIYYIRFKIDDAFYIRKLVIQ